MPDLQSELSKILTQAKFDDEDASASTEPTSQREVLWGFLHKNPMSTVAELTEKSGMDNQFVAATLSAFAVRGIATRTKVEGRFAYTSAVAEYPRFDPVAHGKRIGQLNKEFLAAAREKKRKTIKIKKPKAKAIKRVDDKPKAAEPKAFNADEIIAGLNVLQARELLMRLKAVFGV